MTRRCVPPALLLALSLVACSGGDAKPAAGRVSPAPPGGTAVATPSRSAAQSGRLAPPAVRMFAGVASSTGVASRFCRKGRCVTDRRAPAPISADTSSVVTFSVDRAPDRAVLDIGGAGATRTSLATATLMAYQGKLAEGTHRLTLTLVWGDSEGTWLFQVTVKPKT